MKKRIFMACVMLSAVLMMSCGDSKESTAKEKDTATKTESTSTDNGTENQGGGEATGGDLQDADLEGLASSLASEIEYEAKQTELDSAAVTNYINLPEGTIAHFYTGTGTTSECTGVFKTASADDAATLVNEIELYVGDMRSSFKDYKPDELTRIDSKVLKTFGNVVVLNISSDSAKAEEIIGRYFQ